MIAAPEVFKSPNSDCWIVFGEAKVEDASSQTGFGGPALSAQSDSINRQAAEEARKIKSSLTAAEAEEGDEADEEGLIAADIEVVMGQVSRPAARRRCWRWKGTER